MPTQYLAFIHSYSISRFMIMPTNQPDTNTQALSNQESKQLRKIGHHLNPVVMVGGNGLTTGVFEEIQRALHDHELIKIKIPAGNKTERNQLSQEIAKHCQAQVVDQIGRVLLLFKKNTQANPKLSNLIRFG